MLSGILQKKSNLVWLWSQKLHKFRLYDNRDWLFRLLWIGRLITRTNIIGKRNKFNYTTCFGPHSHTISLHHHFFYENNRTDNRTNRLINNKLKFNDAATQLCSSHRFIWYPSSISPFIIRVDVASVCEIDFSFTPNRDRFIKVFHTYFREFIFINFLASQVCPNGAN